jgi:general secretion pathway protein A
MATDAVLDRPATAGRHSAGHETPAASSAFEIYSQHFGLRGRPFSLVPDPDFLFWSADHKAAYAMLEYGLATLAPITVITGEIGVGKTTLIRHLLRVAPKDLRIGLISNAHARRGALLHWVLASLGQEVGDRTPYVRRFLQFEALLGSEVAAGRHTVLIFDEAQNLSEQMLDELRCFSNLNVEGCEPVQIILAGQPELARIIGRPRMLQFAQRVSARFHLGAMPPEAVRQYIVHRLKVAGTDREVFSPAACDVVQEASGGLPRVINQICDYSLLYAFADGATDVGVDLVRQVVRDRKIQLLGRSAVSPQSADAGAVTVHW